MNAFSNIWNHPKTSSAGLLIGIVSVASVLSQQGVSIGKVGTGNWVTMFGGVASVLLGLMAKDPGQAQPVTATDAATTLRP